VIVPPAPIAFGGQWIRPRTHLPAKISGSAPEVVRFFFVFFLKPQIYEKITYLKKEVAFLKSLLLSIANQSNLKSFQKAPNGWKKTALLKKPYFLDIKNENRLISDHCLRNRSGAFVFEIVN